MAGYEELDKFVKKFLSLWQAGCDATLHVETKAGNAFVNLQVGLGQAKPPHGGSQDASGGCRGGSPSRHRRRERREAARQASLTAAEEVAAANIEKDDEEANAEEVVAKVENDEEEPKLLEYELKVDAHVDCKNYDIIEAIEVNFDGILNDMKVGKNHEIEKKALAKPSLSSRSFTNNAASVCKQSLAEQQLSPYFV